MTGPAAGFQWLPLQWRFNARDKPDGIPHLPQFWIAVGQIILIDILLGGDNAVVIALACRKLPPKQRTQGILWGTAGAIVLRIVLIFFALTLLAIPFLKIVGARAAGVDRRQAARARA